MPIAIKATVFAADKSVVRNLTFHHEAPSLLVYWPIGIKPRYFVVRSQRGGRGIEYHETTDIMELK